MRSAALPSSKSHHASGFGIGRLVGLQRGDLLGIQRDVIDAGIVDGAGEEAVVGVASMCRRPIRTRLSPPNFCGCGVS